MTAGANLNRGGRDRRRHGGARACGRISLRNDAVRHRQTGRAAGRDRRHQPAVADDTAKRYGYERAEYDWRAIAEAPDIDAVSVVVANHLHREIVEGLLAAGKHVLCEKPLAGSLADAEAMVDAAEQIGPRDRRRLHLPPVAGSRADPP